MRGHDTKCINDDRFDLRAGDALAFCRSLRFRQFVSRPRNSPHPEERAPARVSKEARRAANVQQCATIGDLLSFLRTPTLNQEANMARVAGVDGAKGGWAVVISENGRLRASCAKSFVEIFERSGTFDIVAVDTPIGLLDAARKGGRSCEQAARSRLNGPRKSSVFSSPARKVLRAVDYESACRLSRSDPPDSPAISRQTFGILPKIREDLPL